LVLAEFERRFVFGYEDGAIAKNGDVKHSVYHKPTSEEE
jgi:hypothetical protein